MTRLEPDEHPREPRQIPGVALLPSAATLGNLLCGVFAILCCLLSLRAEYLPNDVREVTFRLGVVFPTYITLGAYLVVASLIFDALDGRLARMTRRTSEFGAQLDSISDVVSFGTAPIMLFLTLLLRAAAPAAGGLAQVPAWEWELAIGGALIFVSCAAIRLARFNAENVKDESGQHKFSGLPAPGAAAALVAALLMYENLAATGARLWNVDWALVWRISFGPLAAVLGLLMVSRLDYVHFFNVYVRREQPMSHLVALVVLAAMALWWHQFMFMVLACAYVLSGLLVGRRSKVRRDEERAAARRAKQAEYN